MKRMKNGETTKNGESRSKQKEKEKVKIKNKDEGTDIDLHVLIEGYIDITICIRF